MRTSGTTHNIAKAIASKPIKISAPDTCSLNVNRAPATESLASHSSKHFPKLTPEQRQQDKPLRIALVGYRSHPHVGGQGIYIRHLAIALTKLGHCVDVISGPPYPELPNEIKLIKLPSLDLYASPNHVTALRPKHLASFSDFYEWWSMLVGKFAEPYTFSRRLAKYLKAQSDLQVQHDLKAQQRKTQHRKTRSILVRKRTIQSLQTVSNGTIPNSKALEVQLFEYDVIHDNQSLGYGLLDIKQPVIATVHHPITRDREQAVAAAKNGFHRWGTRRWYSFLKMQEKVVRALPHIVTVSQSSRADIETCFGRPINQTHVIANGIDTELFKPLPNRSKKPQQLLTTCSSDQPVKGFSILINAYQSLLNHYPDLQLKIIGSLKEDGDNARLLKKLNLVHQVKFVSGLSDNEMVAAYNEATLYVCPSLYEGFGLPVAEAMSCGTAVVSSDGGALPEVLGDCGILVPAGDSSALKLAIATLLENPAQRIGYEASGRKRAEKTFCWDAVAAEYIALYRQAIKEHK